ncbi:MAG: tyrosine-type recombinase/integrase [Candidatus Aenigmarchaeota archaeon]|nr:tyrosine-type recombinase/integrase [Candidatus Aenigmarchaeota archaeon]
MVSADDRLEKFLQRLENNKDILLSNRRKIAEFIESRKAKGKAANTCLKYLHPLVQMNLRGWVTEPFEKLTKKDIESIVTKSEKVGWSAKTTKNLRVSIKVFYKWLEDPDEEKFAPNEYPQRVKFISTTIPKRQRKELTFNDMLTREEVIKMAQASNNAMHKALLWLAFESGGRPEEVLNLRKSDVIFEKENTKIYLHGAKSRRVSFLVSATEPLRDWLRKHPSADKTDFDVWVTQFSKKKQKENTWTKLDNSGANKMLKKLATKCGIENKRVTLYSLRKGRATELASAPKVTRSILHTVMGWEEGSTISRSYVKINDETVKEAILASNGLELPKHEIESFIECAYCGAKNSPSALYCEKAECGKPLLLGTAQKELQNLLKQLKGGRKALMQQILDDPEFEKEMLRRMEERKAEQSLSKAMKESGYY